MTDSLPARRDVQYIIELEGIVDSRWAQWFNGMSVVFVPSPDNPRRTALIATLPDQSALPPLLAHVAGLNLKIVSVTPGRTTSLDDEAEDAGST